MANRHKRAKGGRVMYTGKGSHVEREAEETGSDHSAEHKRGGRVGKFKSGGTVSGSAPAARLDKRARGGGVGADKAPFSSAHVDGHGNPAANPAPHATHSRPAGIPK